MAAMAKAGAFSMLAETAEEFIQLECARRRNQASLRRRSSLPSQFHVSGHKSRLKEKLAQARRHAFLLRADNKAALVGIIDNVRELANNGDEGGDSSKSSQHKNGPSPLERDRFMAWAADVEKLLFEFEPSENHANDPLLQILECLQFLQDGHVCLAEVAMDARALLERWDRSGVFDSESSSEDEEEGDEDDLHHGNQHGFLGSGTVKDNTRHLEQSYAYQNIRQRAAASIIKRNVLTWVRSKASFCQRVAEIEVFGRTTEALLKELSLTSAALAGASTNGSTDIFALATGRCDPKARYSGNIAFKDLLQFSKHMALFPVDQALRTVEDVTRRRYLYDSRCAMKIQFVWRRVRETVRARRLRRAMEELRLQREQEAQAKREAAKEAKKRKASESVKRKAPKSQLKRTGTIRSPSLTVPSTSSPDTQPATSVLVDSKEPPNEDSPPQTRESAPKRKQSSPPVPPIDVSSPTKSSISSPHDDRSTPSTSTPRSRQRPTRGAGANNNDNDDDTTDVEAAWKSFMDTVAADVAVQEVPNGDAISETPEEGSMGAPIPPVTLPPMEDNWEAWSDDETDTGNNENQDAEANVGRPQSAAKPRSPSAVATPRMKVVVSVNKSSLPDPLARRVSRRDSTTPRENPTRPPTIPSTSVIRPPSSLPFDATLQNHSGPYTGAGQLSLMAPFIDADRTKKAQPAVVPERKHLYELDFTGAKRDDAAIARIANVLSSPVGPEVQPTPRPKTPEKQKLAGALGSAIDTPRVSSRRTTVARLRSITGDQEQTERIRNTLDAENRDAASQARGDVSSRTTPREDNNSSLQATNKPGFFVYGAQGANVHREVVLRKGTMVYTPLNGPPDENPPSATESGAKEVKSWHRSTIAEIPQALATPRPPADRFRPRHKRRLKGPQRQTISGTADELQAVESASTKPTKKGDKRSELPLLLRRSRAATRRRELERSDRFADVGNADLPDIAAPDTNKQMWKRGGELPELALAQIRDRVGYKRRSSRHKRLSIIAGRAPPSGLPVDRSLAGDQPETIFPVEEEHSDEHEFDSSSDGNDSPDEIQDDDSPETRDSSQEQQNYEDDSAVNGLERADSSLRKESNALTEEFQRLHLASRERALSRRQSLLAQLQDEEDAVKGRRQSKEDVKVQRRKRESDLEGRGEGHSNGSSDDSDVEGGTLDFERRDEGLSSRGRRRLRVKTRDASVDLDEELSDEADDAESEEEHVRHHTGMTERERNEAFQTLLTQYLGLLQCAPPLPCAK